MMDMRPVLRDSRLQVCRAFIESGPEAALAAVAAMSIRLARYTVEDELIWRSGYRNLLSVAVGLRLVETFGKNAVQIALNAGPNLYSDLDEVAA